MKHGTRKQSFSDIIEVKTIVRIGGSHGTNITKEVNVPIIPTCKSCKKRYSQCAKENIPCNEYSLLYEKQKKLSRLEKFIKGYTSSFAINEIKKFFHIDKEQATVYYWKWRKNYVRSRGEW